MSQTIRHYVKRRVWWCAAAAIGGWLVLALGGAAGNSLPDGIPKAVMPIAGFLLFGGAIVAMQRIVKCPKCKPLPRAEPVAQSQNPIHPE